MIARAIVPPDFAVHARVHQTLRGPRAQQQVIEAKSRIALPTVPHVIPEGVHRRIGMPRPDRIEPSLLKNLLERSATLRLHQCVVGI